MYTLALWFCVTLLPLANSYSRTDEEDPTNLYNYAAFTVFDDKTDPELRRKSSIFRRYRIPHAAEIMIIQQSRSRDKVTFLVKPEHVGEVTTTVQKRFLTHAITNTSSLQSIYSHVPEVHDSYGELGGGLTSERFMNYPEIKYYLKSMERKYPNKVKRSNIATTFSGENVTMVTITDDVTKSEENARPIIFIEAGANSNEWITISSATHLINLLSTTESLTKDMEWRIIPVLNPDGYKYTWTKERLYSKNLKKEGDTKCFGVNLNRNFDYYWNQFDSSSDLCSVDYAGKDAFSESETRGLRDAVLKVKSRIKAYVSVHSFGQMVLHPPGAPPQEIDEEANKLLETISDNMARTIRQSTGAFYLAGSPTNLLKFSESGTSRDWAHYVAKVPLAFSLDLRDRGEQRHFIEEKFIHPTAMDMWAAMLSLYYEIQTLDSLGTEAYLSRPQTPAEIPETFTFKPETTPAVQGNTSESFNITQVEDMIRDNCTVTESVSCSNGTIVHLNVSEETNSSGLPIKTTSTSKFNDIHIPPGLLQIFSFSAAGEKVKSSSERD